MHKLFQNKRNRDQSYRQMIADGLNVRRFTSRNQCLHPMYIEDYTAELSEEDKSFGNTVYKTLFGRLYGIEDNREY